MTKSAIVTARVDPEIVAGLDLLAHRLERSRAWVVAKALERYVADERAFLDFLQEGVDALDRGDYITHEQLCAEINARIEAKKAA
jgi:predicted transcriptional regulator